MRGYGLWWGWDWGFGILMSGGMRRRRGRRDREYDVIRQPRSPRGWPGVAPSQPPPPPIRRGTASIRGVSPAGEAAGAGHGRAASSAAVRC
uniref:Uncharacterized protein n=1 Tax=Oryza punctata TaxID=4537 RepID=A0A0E0JEF1_ORYPU